MKHIYLLFAILLVSCSPMKNLERPVPKSNNEGTFFTAKDGAKIFVYDYKPVEDYKSTIYVISGVTGINHNNERDVIELLSDHKNRVVIIHPRGTGYSDGTRGDISNFEDFINDYVDIIINDSDYISQKHKTILYGHSMSCAVALSVAEKLGKSNGVILVNPPYVLKSAKGMSPSISQYVKYAIYSIFAPHTPIVNLAGDPTKIQNDADRKDAEFRANDPLLVKYFSLYVMFNSRKMMDSMLKNAQKADYPMLLIYGMKDIIVDKKGCDKIFEDWKNPNKRYVLVEDGPHGKETVFKAKDTIVNWINGL